MENYSVRFTIEKIYIYIPLILRLYYLDENAF